MKAGACASRCHWSLDKLEVRVLVGCGNPGVEGDAHVCRYRPDRGGGGHSHAPHFTASVQVSMTTEAARADLRAELRRAIL